MSVCMIMNISKDKYATAARSANPEQIFTLTLILNIHQNIDGNNFRVTDSYEFKLCDRGT